MSQVPLTSIDCDLRDFAFMPLDVVRLRDSDLAALESPEACWAAVLLWCASWHQIPAASLPDDDRVLANLAGFGRVVKEWQKVRAGALRGWVKCDDGRLYHPVIADKANEAFTRKLEQSWRTECARIKKHNQRYQEFPGKQINSPSLEEFLSQRQFKDVPRDNSKCPDVVPMETPSNRQGEGQGQGNIKPITQPDANAKFAMRLGWKPSDHLPDLAKQSGVTIKPEKLGEFIAHWLTQPLTQRTQAEWDKALMQSARHDKLHADSSPAKTAKPENFEQRNYGEGVTAL